MIAREEWLEHQRFEQAWHAQSPSNFHEQAKHLTYARRMGLDPVNDGGVWPILDLPGRAVVDIGGGPASMLLCVRGAARRTVVDPCEYPLWVRLRYEEAGIGLIRLPAEDPDAIPASDEAWLYNVLQHTMDPEAIVRNAVAAAGVVRIFEWVDFPPSPGHPHELKADELASWFPTGGEHWFETDEVRWDLNVDERRRYGGRAFYGYAYT